MLCSRCQTENPSGSRYCLQCGLPFKRQCSSCQTELSPGARFCMHCGQPVLEPTPADDGRLSRLVAAAPDPLAKKVRAAINLSGERRPVTALLVDVVGSTAMAERVSVETWTGIINGAFDRIAPIVYRFEGTIARLLGDSLLAFFGVPLAHEDDPIRAVRTALEIIHSLKIYAQNILNDFDLEFSVRACINTGPIALGIIGEDLKYDYTAMGGTINLTSRMKFITPPMSVVVSENTHRFISPIFDTEDLGLVKVKGRPEPMHAFRVVKPKSMTGHLRGFARLGSPMVGRKAELARLVQVCDAVQAGLGRAVLITGEPGLGKTRLVAEWKTTVMGGHVQPPPQWYTGYCLSFGQGMAYHLLIDVLQSMLGVANISDEQEVREALTAFTHGLFGGSMNEVYPYLAHLLNININGKKAGSADLLDPQALHNQYLIVFRRLLMALSARSPLVIILEDLHWADPSSVEIIIKLLPMVSATRMVLCMVGRPDYNSPGWRLVSAARDVLGESLTRITLDALDDKEVRQLVANLLEIEALPEAVRKLILKKAEGNPFFVEEVIRMLIERGLITQTERGWSATGDIQELDIPDNLHGLLQARIDRLPDEARYTLLVASVIGRQFPVKVLEQVLTRGMSWNY